jgi:hypothetical protein
MLADLRKQVLRRRKRIELGLGHLRQCVFLDRLEQHSQHIDLEEAVHDGLQLEADQARTDGNRVGGKQVASELVVALDGTGDKGFIPVIFPVPMRPDSGWQL